jgi:hypothetical protein
MRGGMMEGFIHDSMTFKVRLLTSCCSTCAELIEIMFVPAEFAPFMPDVPTYRAAEAQRGEWDQEHARECKQSRPWHLTAV